MVNDHVYFGFALSNLFSGTRHILAHHTVVKFSEELLIEYDLTEVWMFDCLYHSLADNVFILADFEY